MFCSSQRWELIEPLIRQQDLCLAISAFTAGSKVKMEPCNTKEPRQVRATDLSHIRKVAVIPVLNYSHNNSQSVKGFFL